MSQPALQPHHDSETRLPPGFAHDADLGSHFLRGQGTRPDTARGAVAVAQSVEQWAGRARPSGPIHRCGAERRTRAGP